MSNSKIKSNGKVLPNKFVDLNFQLFVIFSVFLPGTDKRKVNNLNVLFEDISILTTSAFFDYKISLNQEILPDRRFVNVSIYSWAMMSKTVYTIITHLFDKILKILFVIILNLQNNTIISTYL